jgi:hypothetical protein
MGELLERVKLNLLVYGNGIEENFRTNSAFFADKYSKSDKMVTALSTADLQPGGFYFLHYFDDSNWMKYSPVFVISIKKFENLQIVMAVNFNFVPLEVRTSIFDNIIVDKNSNEIIDKKSNKNVDNNSYIIVINDDNNFTLNKSKKSNCFSYFCFLKIIFQISILTTMNYIIFYKL